MLALCELNMKRYKNNSEGDFFVEDEECILCCIPESEAPELMESDDHSCYFKRQPKTDTEISNAIDAVSVSCCGAVKYGGNDTNIIRKILIQSNADISSIIQKGIAAEVLAELNQSDSGRN